MTKENRNVLQTVLMLFISCIFLGMFSYIFDCIYDFEFASQWPVYLPYYMFMYLITRTFGIVPLIVLYYLLSTNSKHVLLKILAVVLVVGIAAILGKYVGVDDVSSSLKVRHWKFIPVYAAAALSSSLVYEWILQRNKKRDQQVSK